MKLTRGQEIAYMNKASQLYKEGKTTEEIAEIMGLPLKQVQKWIVFYNKARSI